MESTFCFIISEVWAASKGKYGSASGGNVPIYTIFILQPSYC